MGKSPKPLTFLVDPALYAWEEIKAYEEQGHVVHVRPDPLQWMAGYDLILGPTCWLMDDAHRQYLKLAIQEARRRRYPKGE